MWSETVGLRIRPVWDQKIALGLGLAGLVLCCETQSCHVRRHMILKDTTTFQVLFIVFLFCAWNITTVEINSGFHTLLCAFVYYQWSWSYYFGLGLKNLVILTSLFIYEWETVTVFTLFYSFFCEKIFIPEGHSLQQMHIPTTAKQSTT